MMTVDKQQDFVKESCLVYGKLSAASTRTIMDVARMLSLFSDISNYEVFIDIKVPGEDLMFVVAEHLSEKSYYENSYLGDFILRENEPAVFEAYETGLVCESIGISISKKHGGKIITNQRAIPVFRDEQVIAVLILEKAINVQGESPASNLVRSGKISEIMLTLMEAKSTVYDLQVREGVMFFDCEGMLFYANEYCEGLYRSFGYASILDRHFDVLNLAQSTFSSLLSAFTRNRALMLEQGEDSEEISDYSQVSLFQESTAIVGTKYFRIRIAVLTELEDFIIMFIDDITQTRRLENSNNGYLITNSEMQHRIKNNLMTVASLLRMQARQCSNDEARDIINVGVNRILSISATFDSLTRGKSTTVSVLEVLRRICDNHMELLSNDGPRLDIEISGEDFVLDSDVSTTLGLIVNELVQNAIRHAFPKKEQGRLKITTASDEGSKIIRICDDGVGFDPEDVSQWSLGLTITKELVHENLRGKITFESDENGTTISIVFKQHGKRDKSSER